MATTGSGERIAVLEQTQVSMMVTTGRHLLVFVILPLHYDC